MVRSSLSRDGFRLPGNLKSRSLEAFLAELGAAFVVDRTREKFGLTFNPAGYLRRR